MLISPQVWSYRAPACAQTRKCLANTRLICHSNWVNWDLLRTWCYTRSWMDFVEIINHTRNLATRRHDFWYSWRSNSGPPISILMLVYRGLFDSSAVIAVVVVRAFRYGESTNISCSRTIACNAHCGATRYSSFFLMLVSWVLWISIIASRLGMISTPTSICSCYTKQGNDIEVDLLKAHSHVS